MRKYRAENLESERAKARIRVAAWKKANPEKAKAQRKRYRKAHRELYRKAHHKWLLANPDKAKTATIVWRLRNKERMNSVHLANHNRRYQSDPVYRMRQQLRGRVSQALRSAGIKRSARTMELVGCSVEDLRRHIESLWQLGMTWANHSVQGWHIDHIRPCFTFDLTKPEEQRACFHWSNLRPLWAKDNLSRPKRLESLAQT